MFSFFCSADQVNKSIRRIPSLHQSLGTNAKEREGEKGGRQRRGDGESNLSLTSLNKEIKEIQSASHPIAFGLHPSIHPSVHPFQSVSPVPVPIPVHSIPCQSPFPSEQFLQRVGCKQRKRKEKGLGLSSGEQENPKQPTIHPSHQCKRNKNRKKEVFNRARREKGKKQMGRSKNAQKLQCWFAAALIHSEAKEKMSLFPQISQWSYVLVIGIQHGRPFWVALVKSQHNRGVRISVRGISHRKEGEVVYYVEACYV